jgi:hypothetical protein
MRVCLYLAIFENISENKFSEFEMKKLVFDL